MTVKDLDLDVDQDFIDFCESLPAVRTRKFETSIADWSIEYGLDKQEMLYSLVKGQSPIIHENEMHIRFVAFLALCISFRRLKETSKYEAIINHYGDLFSTFELYPHFCSMMYKEKKNEESYQSAILYAEEAVIRLPSQEGVLHNYAETIVIALEEGYGINSNLLEKAEELLNRAISLSPKYAKFHYTKGRILSLKKQYKRANEAILKAIDLEDSSKKDYVLRINEYQTQLAAIRNQQLNAKLEESIQDLQASKEAMSESLEKSKTENLQMLGFFVAIITFTIGSFNLTKQESVMDTVFLLFILSGCLTISYVAFSVLFSDIKKNRTKILYAFLLGALLIGLGFGVHFLL
ncbi:tetratricopeptide repeat protein [Mesobacillus sp. LC4]